MDRWNTLPWKQFQRHVFKLQKRIYRASGRGEVDGDSLEVDHLRPQSRGGSDGITNLQLLHRHCHDSKTARDLRCRGPSDTRHVVEEPDEAKVSRPVL